MKFSLLLIFQTVLALWLLTACQPNFLPPISLEENISQINTTSHPRWQRMEGDGSSGWELFMTPEYISGIVVDGDSLWASSNAGLLRWDRVTGSVDQYLYPAFQLPGNRLGGLIHYQGKLVATGNKGVAFFDGFDNWQFFQNQEIGMSISSRSPLMVYQDTLWTAGRDGLARYSPQSGWESFPLGDGIKPLDYLERIFAKDAAIFVVVRSDSSWQAGRTVIRFANNIWEVVDRPELAYLQADGVHYRANRSLLTRSLDGGQSWETITEVPGIAFLPHIVDSDRRIYASQADVIHIVEDDQIVESYDFTALGPELTLINLLQWDTEGRLWIATDGRGLSMYDGEKWQNWQPENSNLRQDAIRSMDVSADKVYAGTFSSAASGGVNILDIESGEWINFWPGESPLSGGGVGGVAVADDGSVFLPTAKSVLDIYKDGQWRHVFMPIPESGSITIEDATFGTNGDYWVAASRHGVWKLNEHGWTVYNLADILTEVTVGPDGAIWIGGYLNIFRRTPEGIWERYEWNEMPISGWVGDMAADVEGRVWVVTLGGGFVVLDGKRISQLDEAELDVNWGDAVVFDENGELWVALNNGVAHFQGDLETLMTNSIPMLPMATAADEDLATFQMFAGQLPTPTPGPSPTLTPIPQRPIATPTPIDPNVLMDPEYMMARLACIGCHHLNQPQTPENRGIVGPNLGNLAEVVENRNLEEDPFTHVYNSIVDPNAYVTEGYVPGIMPQTYAETMTDEEIRSLVEWLLTPRDN